MPRSALLLTAVLALAACDATNEVQGIGGAGPALAIDSLVVSASEVNTGTRTVVVRGITGGSPTASDTLRLDAGTSYSGVVRVADGAQDDEVLAEAESHLFTFASSTDALTASPTDRESLYAVQNLNDGDYPVGRTFRLRAASDADGEATLTISLVRYDGAPKSDGAGTGGTVDLSVAIPVLFDAAGG